MVAENRKDARTALVTGASRGIGRAIALQLARDGFDVGVNYRAGSVQANETVVEINRLGRRAAAFMADMSKPAEATSLVERVENQLGPLAILVSNAGITRDRLLIQMSGDDWDATWTTDLVGPRALCRRALETMQDRSGGAIITVSSVVGSTGNAGQANYAAAKFALQGLTRELAVEAAPFNVSVNCIVPGFFPTDAVSHLSEQQRNGWIGRIPMGRQGRVEDIAALASFLAGEAGRYITGQCIAVDGGLLADAGKGLNS